MQLEITINASPDRVWAHLSDLASHAEWMKDAETIRFGTDQTRGVGVVMEAPTRIGPFRTLDVMTVTEWEEGHLISASHQGVVTGEGSFEIVPNDRGTTLIWSEDLRFPWWMGGPVGAIVARPIFRAVWTKNLKRFRQRVESS